MAEAKPTLKPVIHKPPGYRDPEAPPPTVPKAPPRRRPLPPSFRQPGKPLPRRHRSRRSCCCRLCCWASVAVLALAALIAVAAGLAYLWFQPKLPSFRLESLNATRLRVSSRPDGTFLDVSTSVGILVSNPNGKIVLEYGDWEARVRVADDDGDVDVGVAEVAGFEQGRRNRTVVRFQTAAKAVAVDEVAGGRIQEGFRSKEIKLGVNLRTRMGLRPNPSDVYSRFCSNFAVDAQSTESIMMNLALPDSILGNFTINADQLRRLKEMASSKSKYPFQCSTIVVTYAYAWVCLVKARGYPEEKHLLLAFPGDCRQRIQPPLPAEYFGNCIAGYFVEAKAGDLAGEDGFTTAARLVSETIKRLKDDPLEGMDNWPEKYREVGMQQPFSVAGSPRFKVYDVDFGWGRPVKVAVPSIAWIGAMSVSESRDADGGVEIGLALPKQEMDEFGAQFSLGLKL